MTDRSDNILYLAQELLRTDFALPVTPPVSPKFTINFKIMCLATMLTAFGSSSITFWVTETKRPLNRYEKTELDALVFYAAHQKGIHEESLRHDVEQKLGVTRFEDMTKDDFQNARRYLQDKV